jgi:hypothetical protein
MHTTVSIPLASRQQAHAQWSYFGGPFSTLKSACTTLQPRMLDDEETILQMQATAYWYMGLFV